MKYTTAIVTCLGAVLLGPAACITVNIYFPAAEVRAAAEDIVEETWGGTSGTQPQSAPAPAADSTKPRAWLRRPGASVAWAEDAPNIEVSTAAIRALKAAMKDRAGSLKPYLAQGNVGIGNDGMLVVRGVDSVSLGEQAKIRRLVEAENRDREALYTAIAEANGYGDDRIADIRKIFAETWVEKAESGWPIQTPTGTWTTR